MALTRSLDAWFRKNVHGNILPVNKVSVPVDVEAAKRTLKLNPGDTIVSELKLEIKKGYFQKNDLAVLAVIAANKWQRPIYFTMPYGELGFGNYIRRDGLSYRLVPVENSNVNTDWTYNVMMTKFGFGNANIPNVYFDEENRRHLNTIRKAEVDLAFDLVNKNKKDSAKSVLERCDKMMLQENFPYGGFRFATRLVCELGLASLISLLVFAGLWFAYRRKLSGLLQECRRLVAKLLEARQEPPHLQTSDAPAAKTLSPAPANPSASFGH